MTVLQIPEFALVLLMGPSGAGKSTFGRRHFLPSEVVSSDHCREMVCDDEGSQEANVEAFKILHMVVEARLKLGRFTVVDATNVEPEARRPLIALAKKYHAFAVAVVLDLPAELCIARNDNRVGRPQSQRYVEKQALNLRQSLKRLEKDGVRYVHIFKTPEAIESLTIEKQRLWTNRRDDHGLFDLIGDIHGCCDELRDLLAGLGYCAESVSVDTTKNGIITEDTSEIYRHPEGRRVIFLGDFVDRGPKVLETAKLVMNMTAAGTALCVPGNHEVKLLKHLDGRQVRVSHGLEQSIAEFSAAPPEFVPQFREFLRGLVSHYVLDRGRLVAAHAGLSEELQGRTSGVVRSFALYGETTGETDEFGLPVRHPWARSYRGKAVVVYGHTPVPEAEWLNNTICVDTGCVYGGKLTALRWPERELLSVPAQRVYCEPAKPLKMPNAPGDQRSDQQVADDILEIADVTGKMLIETRLSGRLAIKAEQSAAALETMSRFGVDPRWLIYLPPTMSPPETSALPGLLEHPAEAFQYYEKRGVKTVICEEKHMGSRAIVVICRDAATAKRRFGVTDGSMGLVYSRSGRRFFKDLSLEAELLTRLSVAAENAAIWAELKSDWMVIDAEILPWSFKAGDLIQRQYASVGDSGKAMLSSALTIIDSAIDSATGSRDELISLSGKLAEQLDSVTRYCEAYRRFVWPVHGLTDLKVAPFHLLASEGSVHTDKNHPWHLSILKRLAEADPAVFQETKFRLVDITSADSKSEAKAWWQEITTAGAEGMVVKPCNFTASQQGKLIQPALKVRGAEYLRLIYGPEYLVADNLERLRTRSLSTKRSLAIREFSLGLEALERFVRREPLRKVHECVFGVLALESEVVDVRL